MICLWRRAKREQKNLHARQVLHQNSPFLTLLMREALRKFAFICVAINHAELAQAIREEGGCCVHIYYFFLAI